VSLFGLFESRNVENPARPLTDSSLIDTLGGEPTDSGEQVTEQTAYRMTAVYRAIALLAGLVGGLPLHAYSRGEGRRDRASSSLLDDPNPERTAFELWEAAAQSLLSDGNAYLWIERDGNRAARFLWPLRADTVDVEAVNPNDPRTGKTFRLNGKLVAADRILHIPGLSYDGITGLSPIGMARQAVGISFAAERFAARMYERGALTQGVLETEQKLDKDQATRLQAAWQQKTAGGLNQWRIPVLDAGAKFRGIGLPPEDAQYLQIRRFGVVEIARLYGIPPHLLADVERSTSWGSGIEHQNMQMLTYTIDPWLVRIEQRVSRLLPEGKYAKFTRQALLRADTGTRYLAYQRALMHGWMNPDEVREREDMDPIPGAAGQNFYRPANLTPLGEGDSSADT
jgi:HK97 family phage portal protein